MPAFAGIFFLGAPQNLKNFVGIIPPAFAGVLVFKMQVLMRLI